MIIGKQLQGLLSLNVVIQVEQRRRLQRPLAAYYRAQLRTQSVDELILSFVRGAHAVALGGAARGGAGIGIGERGNPRESRRQRDGDRRRVAVLEALAEEGAVLALRVAHRERARGGVVRREEGAQAGVVVVGNRLEKVLHTIGTS